MTDDKAMAGGTCNILKFSDTNSNVGKFQVLAVKKIGPFLSHFINDAKKPFQKQATNP